MATSTARPAARRTETNGSARNGSAKEAATAEEVLAREVAVALQALAAGDFSVRMTSRRAGPLGDVAKAFNAVAECNAKLHKELGRVGRVVGREGRMSERVALE